MFIVLCYTQLHAALLSYPTDLANNVTTFGASGADNVDDIKAIRDALAKDRSDVNADYNGRPKILYFPAGTYIISDSITWDGCAVTIQGQGTGATIFKLKDGAAGFNDPTHPKGVFVTPSGNMAFRQNFHDLTINTGTNNSGAMGLDYISSNTGRVRDVEIISGDGAGVAGLSMMRQWPGPLLIKNLKVTGFNYGMQAGTAEYGPTFENLDLKNQLKARILNQGNILAIRKYTSVNTVPAIQNPSGFVICLD